MKDNKLRLIHREGFLDSLSFNGKEFLIAPSPLFTICMRAVNGSTVILRFDEASSIIEDGDKTVFSGFAVSVTVIRTTAADSIFAIRLNTVTLRSLALG